MNNSTNNSAGCCGGIGLGTVIAVVLSWSANHSYNLINRISKSIKKELIQHKISKIEKDF